VGSSPTFGIKNRGHYTHRRVSPFLLAEDGLKKTPPGRGGRSRTGIKALTRKETSASSIKTPLGGKGFAGLRAEGQRIPRNAGFCVASLTGVSLEAKQDAGFGDNPRFCVDLRCDIGEY